MSLAIPRDVYEDMVAHCRTGLPNEACGFLGGNEDVVERLYCLPNQAESPVFYRPAPREMIAAYNDMDERGLELLAIFHSHVATAPRPSPTDVHEARIPAVYVIVSLADPDDPQTRGWHIHKTDWSVDEGEVEEVDLVIS
jgi:[CysO sulfur-carrier protein]-S-L-cysteine hydrolase